MWNRALLDCNRGGIKRNVCVLPSREIQSIYRTEHLLKLQSWILCLYFSTRNLCSMPPR
jgi:hypothetical protein